MTRILVVDDDLAIREMVAMTLEKSGYRVERADGYAAALAAIRDRRPDLIVSDIYMPGGTGMDLLKEVQERSDPPPMILMTAKATIETAASALKDGVFDYLAKPFDLDVMLERVRAALASHAPSAPSEASGPGSMIIGSHPAIVEVYKAISRVAPLQVPVLIFGETGTGKELVAQALHRFGAHPEGPFIPIHCGAIPDTLIESELFGHRRGAFTDAHSDRRGALAQANGGTVFFDEIGEISPVFQVKLLRFLEDGVIQPLGAETAEPVEARVIAATHRDLRAMVASGEFREDLYYRLDVVNIEIPPLRSRIEDIPVLAHHFIPHIRKVTESNVEGLTDEVLDLFTKHAWPGNVREIENMMERALIRNRTQTESRYLCFDDFMFPPGKCDSNAESDSPFSDHAIGKIDEILTSHIQHALQLSKGKVEGPNGAAQMLGINPNTLRSRMKKLGIAYGKRFTGRPSAIA